MMADYHFEDFTEDAYRNLLETAKTHWAFITYPDYQQPGRVCLWRHDVDFSIHRAYRLAQIEAEVGITATYFIHLHSQFYHPLEKEVAQLIRAIQALGHALGLHFDPAFYDQRLQTIDDLTRYLNLERHILTQTFETEIRVFSFHNPDVGDWHKIEQDEIGGMLNTYGPYFKQHYSYCSDSNGYWRFRRLAAVVCAATDEKLQVLTHPSWWVPQVLSPRDRVARCIEGRAVNTAQSYDQALARMGRQNVR